MSNICLMPKKIRELIKKLENAEFINRGGKGSHRNFTHPNVKKPITSSGKDSDDAKHYQEKAVQLALKEAKNEKRRV
ncbi:MAG: type II toxin-antitoxin system HicA family toxin [bacterium]